MTRAALLLATALLALPGAASALCPCLRCALYPASFRSYWSPSSAMEPALMTGQCFQMAVTRPDTPLPPRGQIITFDSPLTGELHAMRVIAVAGDRIELRGGQVILNGETVPQVPAPDFVTAAQSGSHTHRCTKTTDGECHVTRTAETLPGGASHEVLNLQDDAFQDEMAPVTVPAGHVFVLGDNRDNALDSRFTLAMGGPGLIPLAAIRDRVIDATAP